MEPELETAAPTSTLGYDRAAVEAFLAAAAEEKQKLEEQIEQSNLRLTRARTALGTHRVMVAMLLETQRELSTIRRDAEREAAEIIAAAERQVREHEQAPSVAPEPMAAEASIDLRNDASELGDGASASPAFAGRASASDGDDLLASIGEDEDFFAYLRGALHDDEPLGPRVGEADSR